MLDDRHLAGVPATQLALEHVGRPVPNAALLGAVAALCEIVLIDAVTASIGQRFSDRPAAGNVATARAAHELTVRHLATARAVRDFRPVGRSFRHFAAASARARLSRMGRLDTIGSAAHPAAGPGVPP